MKTSLAGSTSVIDGQTDRIAVAYIALAWNAFRRKTRELWRILLQSSSGVRLERHRRQLHCHLRCAVRRNAAGASRDSSVHRRRAPARRSSGAGPAVNTHAQDCAIN